MGNVRRQQLIVHIVCLITGSLIYICFRTNTLVMFKWFDNMMLTGAITAIREYSFPFRHNLPSWFLYSLPDGLWIASYTCFMLFVWGRNINFFWLTLLPMIAILSEIGQLFRVVPGTFDIMDIVFYVAGSFLPLVIFNNLTIPIYSRRFQSGNFNFNVLSYV